MRSVFAKYIIVFYCLILSSSLFAAVSATLDRNSVGLNDQVTLTISIDGVNDEQVDLSPLTKDFTILKQGQYSNLSMINGVTSSHNQLVITLVPNKTGNLTIPALTLGQDQTPALKLTVTAASATSSNNTATKSSAATYSPTRPYPDLATQIKDRAFIESTVNVADPVVDQPIVYTASVYLEESVAENLSQTGSIEPPTLNGVTGKPLGKLSVGKTVRAGKVYYVLQQRYLFTPTSSGAQTISPLQMTGMMTVTVDHSSDPFSNDMALMDTVEESVTLKAKPVNFTVKPAALPIDNWLPAKSLTVNEQWSDNLNNWHVGQPLTRIITWQGSDLDEMRLPQLTATTIPGANVYPEKPVTNLILQQQNLIANSQQKIVYIPTTAGTFNIPAEKITWWDTTTHKPMTTTLPAKQLTILPGAGKLTEATPPVTSNTSASVPIKINTAVEHSNARPWMLIAIFFGILWLITLAWWWQQKRALTKAQPLSVRQAQRALQQACRQNDMAAAKNALLAYARQSWPRSNFRTLGDVTQMISDETLASAIRALDQVLYADNENNTWDGTTFWTVFQRGIKSSAKKYKSNQAGLPPLYPN